MAFLEKKYVAVCKVTTEAGTLAGLIGHGNAVRNTFFKRPNPGKALQMRL